MSGGDLMIRDFAASDLDALQRIREAAFAPVFASFRALVGAEIAARALAQAETDQAKLLEDLCASGSGSEVLVAALEGQPVGFVAFTIDAGRRKGEIGLNAVHPRHAGRGIGTALYEAALARMKPRGVVVVEVGTGGDPSHAAARRAYEKAGFGHPIPSMALYRLL